MREVILNNPFTVDGFITKSFQHIYVAYVLVWYCCACIMSQH